MINHAAGRTYFNLQKQNTAQMNSSSRPSEDFRRLGSLHIRICSYQYFEQQLKVVASEACRLNINSQPLKAQCAKLWGAPVIRDIAETKVKDIFDLPSFQLTLPYSANVQNVTKTAQWNVSLPTRPSPLHPQRTDSHT